MLLKLYCNLGIVSVPFALKDDTIAVFRVTDAGTFGQAGLSAGLGDVEFGAGELLAGSLAGSLAAAGEEAGDVVDGLAAAGGFSG